ncbi:hypothetical protein B808_51 [Fructilactobacillus florum 8D]|uniref:DUF1516 family protein n=1 Tax=Fructilactobacillus florum 8D TaxID=1221538 RepID=W9EG35_9LACO|nr:DUF1516 family protein [Fructilactobacillus florum]EKK21211.1 hypothetical protein B807_2 [Fructilactobacillus florum 2F]ETO41022.1 hypothetical protein B808_51 [Fructilactobacillus florum 8D]
MLINWIYLINLIDLISWLALIVAVLVALLCKQSSLSNKSMRVARLFYLIVIGSDLLLIVGYLHNDLLLRAFELKILVILLLIALIEMAFALHLHKRFSKWWIYLTFFLLLIVGIYDIAYGSAQFG